jgi:hypothetical protein
MKQEVSSRVFQIFGFRIRLHATGADFQWVAAMAASTAAK